MNSRTVLAGSMMLVLALALAGCGHRGASGETGEPHDDHDHAEADHAGAGHAAEAEGLVHLTREQLQASGITVTVAGPREISIVQELPGEVVVNADGLAHIVPRFAGIAREVRRNLGDPVKAGEVMAVVEANESLALYEVKSLVAGTVIEKHVTLGEFVTDDQDIYVVADLSRVWVNLSVYARDLERIRVGQTAVIEATGISDSAEGRIDYLGPVVGEATRTSIARIVLPNPRGVWRPGLFVTAHVLVEARPTALAVPDEAIQTVHGERVVFVEEGDAFRRQDVEPGRTDGRWTEILAGLTAGDRVAAENSFILKSELLKGEAGHGHEH